MNRRSFLKSAVAVIAAPAIVHAESLMKIWVPRDESIFIPSSRFQIVYSEHGIRIVDLSRVDMAAGLDRSVVFSVCARTGDMMIVGTPEVLP